MGTSLASGPVFGTAGPEPPEDGMSLLIDAHDPKQARITFILPADEPAGAVSVVGSFNDWTPGEHELAPDGNGQRSVTISVPYNAAIHFRYLASNDVWIDEPDADEVTAMGSLLNPLPAPKARTPRNRTTRKRQTGS